MSEQESKVLTAATLAMDFEAIYRDILREEISDADLAPLLLDSNFFAIRDASDQELFFATSNYLGTFLAAAVPPTVTFNQERLQIWAKEALEFARQNVKHEAFADIFSMRMQYESVLRSILNFQEEGEFLQEYFEQLRIESVYFAELLPEPFFAAMQNAARKAVNPALLSLAHHLTRHGRIGKPRDSARTRGVLAVKRTPSFLNQNGTIPFSENDGKFQLSPSSELDQIKNYQPVVNRAIKSLVEARVIQRIGNMDRLLAGLLSEYRDEVARGAKRARVAMLWTIGIEIEARIRAQDTVLDKDERLDDVDMFDLRRLMAAHNLYLNCFSQTSSLLRDIESSAAIYQRISAAGRQLPALVLRKAIDAQFLLEPEAAETISRSIVMEEPSVIESKGAVALRLGLLRGLLHAAGGHLLAGIEQVASKTAVDMTSKALIQLLQADVRFTGVVTFLIHQSTALTQLSDQAPIYFGYVRGILALLGINV